MALLSLAVPNLSDGLGTELLLGAQVGLLCNVMSNEWRVAAL
jgi:hypothetical protein